MGDWWARFDPDVQLGFLTTLLSTIVGGLFTLVTAMVQGHRAESGGAGGRQLRQSPYLRLALYIGVIIASASLLATAILGIVGTRVGPGPSPDPAADAAPVPSGTTASAAPPDGPETGTSYPPGHRTRVLDEPMIAANGRWANFRPDNGTCRFAEDGLHVGANNYYHECYASVPVRDFTYEVQFSFGTAKVAGIFFRQGGDGSWYSAAVGRSGRVWITKGVNGAPADLVEKTVAPPDAGQRHRLAVTGVGEKLTVYVDGKAAASATDGQFPEGPIGVFTDGGRADGAGTSGETIFHHVWLWAP